ncbi:MAG: hypothetical protein WCA79_07425 [Anaerolineales bacterium]
MAKTPLFDAKFNKSEFETLGSDMCKGFCSDFQGDPLSSAKQFPSCGGYLAHPFAFLIQNA